MTPSIGLASLLVFLAFPQQIASLLLGVGLLLGGQRFYSGGFLWLAFLPGLLLAPGPDWPQAWALTSSALLLYGLFLSKKERPWASLPLLPLALLAGPFGLFLLGAVHALSLLEEAKKEAQARGEAFRLPPWTPLWPLLLGALALGLGFLPLAWPHLPWPQGPSLGFRATPEGAPGPEGERVAYAEPEGGFPLWVRLLDQALGYALPLSLGLLLLALLPLLGRGGRLPHRGAHLLPLLLALTAGLALLLFLGSLGGGTSGGGGMGTAPGPAPSPEEAPLTLRPGPRRLGEVGVALAGGMALLSLLLFLSLALWTWRGRGGGGEEVEAQGTRESPRRLWATLPQNRIRRAYARALKALAGAGLGRYPFEGPLEYRDRVQTALPEAGPPLVALTRLYLPVRYGGEAGEAEAERAEEALRSILELCSTPKSKPPSKTGSS